MVIPARRRRAVHKPRPSQRSWITGAMVDAAIIVGATLATTLFLLFVSGQLHDTTSGNLIWSPAHQTAATAQPTPESSQSAHPSPSSQASRSLATPTPAALVGGATADTPDDSAIQAEIDKGIADDPNFSTLDITATVTKGKVILVGTVPTNELKTRIEKLVRAVKGVKDVDNQIVVVSGT